ncbi:MAG: hypothetical protein ACD_21C00141G0001 [uncultured bacterium]|nr:MAG: hypothetical protein ACD_21C00141G0001 [uncultured bacterium]
MKSILFLFSLLISTTGFAVCPLCTFAVGAGIGLAQYLGIDDTISGIWIGGLIVSLIAWTISWCNKKNVHFYGRKILITIIYYGMIIIPLYYCGIMGHALNRFWGMDKILLGIIVGSIVFFSGALSYGLLKKKNDNKAYFSFQKVVMPVLPLIILSIIFYYLTK